MKRLVILSACLAISLAGWAQGNRNDSLRMDSIIHSLPDVMVKGNRPIVKVKGETLTYDLPQLIKNHPLAASEAVKCVETNVFSLIDEKSKPKIWRYELKSVTLHPLIKQSETVIHCDCKTTSIAFPPIGEMAEWSNAPVLKTGVLRGTGGSNPSLSAM